MLLRRCFFVLPASRVDLSRASQWPTQVQRAANHALANLYQEARVLEFYQASEGHSLLFKSQGLRSFAVCIAPPCVAGGSSCLTRRCRYPTDLLVTCVLGFSRGSQLQPPSGAILKCSGLLGFFACKCPDLFEASKCVVRAWAAQYGCLQRACACAIIFSSHKLFIIIGTKWLNVFVFAGLSLLRAAWSGPGVACLLH